MKELKQSETIVIKRSEIKFNPLNPKRHSSDNIKRQKKNFKKVGFLGGIVWNSSTGHIIDGHRRMQAMDEYYGYTGAEGEDYEIKVEAVDLSEKEELEQTTYMAVGNTAYDIDLIANYVNEIDYTDIGFSDKELGDILNFASVEAAELVVDTFDDVLTTAPRGKELYDTKTEHAITQGFAPTESLTPSAVVNNVAPPPIDIAVTPNRDDPAREEFDDEFDEETRARKEEERIARIKEAKQQTKDKANEVTSYEDAYITLSFSSMEAKEDFCEMVGVSPDAKFMKGENITAMIS